MNTTVTYPKPLPDLTITHVSGRQLGRSYSETIYEVVSRRVLDAARLAHLDAARVLGVGQAYTVLKEETFTVPSQPMAVDDEGNQRPDLPPLHYGQACKPYDYAYHRYTIRRICDSGD